MVAPQAPFVLVEREAAGVEATVWAGVAVGVGAGVYVGVEVVEGVDEELEEVQVP